jgi:magnesium transporter
MLLTATSVPAATAVLRYVPEPLRAALLDALPTAHALACRALLGFPEDTVGACVDPQVVVLAPDARARDALEALRARRDVAVGPVYVVDAQRRPMGQIEVAALLRAGEHERLDQLAGPVTLPLPALTSIVGAMRHPAWQDADVVPVIDRGDGLVGVVQRRDLLRAAQARNAPDRQETQTLTGLLAGGYWQTVSGLLDAVVAALMAAPRSRS